MSHPITDQRSDPLTDEVRDELRGTLASMDYPATPDDLLRAAILDHVHPAAVDLLRLLSRRSYDGGYAIRRELGL